MTGMTSLVSKAQLVTKIYVPRWTIVLGSTMNAMFIFGMNLIVLAIFFSFKNHKLNKLFKVFKRGGEISCVLTTQIVTFEMFFPHQDSHN